MKMVVRETVLQEAHATVTCQLARARSRDMLLSPAQLTVRIRRPGFEEAKCLAL